MEGSCEEENLRGPDKSPAKVVSDFETSLSNHRVMAVVER